MGEMGAHFRQVGVARHRGQGVEVVGTRGVSGPAPAELPAAFEQFLDPRIRHRVHEYAHEESVGEGGQGLVVGQSVGGPHADPQRAPRGGRSSR